MLLPKILYLYRAAPHVLPKLHFDSLDKLLAPCLWRNQVPRLSRDTLKAPYEHGGLALPNLYIYYVAVQLSYASWWLWADSNNLAVVLEAALVGSYEALANLAYREGRPPIQHYTTLMTATVSIWKQFVAVYGDQGSGAAWSPFHCGATQICLCSFPIQIMNFGPRRKLNTCIWKVPSVHLMISD